MSIEIDDGADHWLSNGIGIRQAQPVWRKLMFGLPIGGPGFAATYVPIRAMAIDCREVWAIEGCRLSFLRNKSRTPRVIGSLALMECPLAPEAHTTRLEYSINSRVCDGQNGYDVSTGALAIAIGTALALHRGGKVICVPRAIRDDGETALLQNLGYVETGEYEKGEFVLQRKDYLGGVTAKAEAQGEELDYLSEFEARSKRIIGTDLSGHFYDMVVPEIKPEEESPCRAG